MGARTSPFGRRRGQAVIETWFEGAQRRGNAQCKAAVFFLSSGGGLRSAHSIADDVERGERSGAFAFVAIGLEDAALQTLARFAMRAPLRLRTTEIADFFDWLARTDLELAHSSPGAEVGLELPAWPS